MYDFPNLWSWELWTTGILMFFAGILMTSGGGGGGGVYIALTMLFGNLSAHEAVPLSKFIILLGAMATYCINTRRACIDYKLVRSFAPMSLAGTLIGVALNQYISEVALMVLLSVLLICICIRVVFLTVSSWKFENLTPSFETLVCELPEIREDALDAGNELSATNSPQNFSTRSNSVDGDLDRSADCMEAPKCCGPKSGGLSVNNWDMENTVAVGLIPIVVFFGILSQHVASRTMSWMLFLVPFAFCFVATFLIRQTEHTPLVYPAMGMLGGVVSGLLGIGGGIIYAPFFIHLGVPPDKAVTVATTGILFASLSSASQYLLMGRVYVWLATFFSIFTVLASICAAAMMQFLYIKTKVKQSFVLMCVSCTCALSAICAIIKTVHLLDESGKYVHG